VGRFQEGLAKVIHNVGFLQSKIGQPTEALRAYEQAIAIHEKLAGADPKNAEVQADRASVVGSDPSSPRGGLDRRNTLREPYPSGHHGAVQDHGKLASRPKEFGRFRSLALH